MTEIPQETIREALSGYKPGLVFLREASLEYPVARGRYYIGDTYYLFPPLSHATDVEIQLCLNQLAYVSVAELIKEGKLEEFRGIDFKSFKDEGMLIRESHKIFRKPINPRKEFSGELEVKELRRRTNLILANTRFNFEDGSCIGSLKLVIDARGAKP